MPWSLSLKPGSEPVIIPESAKVHAVTPMIETPLIAKPGVFVPGTTDQGWLPGMPMSKVQKDMFESFIKSVTRMDGMDGIQALQMSQRTEYSPLFRHACKEVARRMGIHGIEDAAASSEPEVKHPFSDGWHDGYAD